MDRPSGSRSAPDAPTGPPRRLASPRDYVLAVLFLTVWLVPMAYVGLIHAPVRGAPIYLNYLYRVACLFTERTAVWSNYYAEVRLEGREDWLEVPESDYSRMHVFGHRTRIHRMLEDSQRSFQGERLRAALSKFIKRRHEELHAGGPPVRAVRFVRVNYAVGGEIAHPPGRWRRLPLDSIPDSRERVISTHPFPAGDPG